MSGFRDLFAFVLGWKSASSTSVIAGPYRVPTGQVYSAGQATGQTYVSGQQEGQVYSAGADVGQVYS